MTFCDTNQKSKAGKCSLVVQMLTALDFFCMVKIAIRISKMDFSI